PRPGPTGPGPTGRDGPRPRRAGPMAELPGLALRPRCIMLLTRTKTARAQSHWRHRKFGTWMIPGPALRAANRVIGFLIMILKAVKFAIRTRLPALMLWPSHPPIMTSGSVPILQDIFRQLDATIDNASSTATIPSGRPCVRRQ